jgi:hypothetical protein
VPATADAATADELYILYSQDAEVFEKFKYDRTGDTECVIFPASSVRENAELPLMVVLVLVTKYPEVFNTSARLFTLSKYRTVPAPVACASTSPGDKVTVDGTVM